MSERQDENSPNKRPEIAATPTNVNTKLVILSPRQFSHTIFSQNGLVFPFCKYRAFVELSSLGDPVNRFIRRLDCVIFTDSAKRRQAFVEFQCGIWWTAVMTERSRRAGRVRRSGSHRKHIVRC